MSLSNHDAATKQEIETQLQLMRNRDKSSDRLRIDEMTVTITRDKYRKICELAHETLIRRMTR